MSLIRSALRMAAVEAIKGRTLVGDRVLDSEIGAITENPDGELHAGQESRFVAVYTMDGAKTDGGNLTRPLLAEGTCELAFEAAFAAAMAMIDNETGTRTIVEGIPVTDGNMEFYLDLLGQQIVAALTDPANAWGQIFSALAPNIRKIEWARIDGNKGTKLAAHQIKLTCDTVSDPLVGGDLDVAGGFAQFLDALEASGDARLAAKATLMRAAIDGASLPDWETIRQRLGWTVAERDATGMAPLDTGDGSAGTAEDGTLHVDGLGDVTVTGDA